MPITIVFSALSKVNITTKSYPDYQIFLRDAERGFNPCWDGPSPNRSGDIVEHPLVRPGSYLGFVYKQDNIYMCEFWKIQAVLDCNHRNDEWKNNDTGSNRQVLVCNTECLGVIEFTELVPFLHKKDRTLVNQNLKYIVNTQFKYMRRYRFEEIKNRLRQ